MHAKSKHPNLLQFDTWTKLVNVTDFSTTSQGGVSTGNYLSFNLGRHTGDESLNVEVNYRFLSKMLSVDSRHLFVPKQVHGDSICVIDDTFLAMDEAAQQSRLEEVDALITNVRNVGIGVVTADCIPLLLYDSKKNILAAVHAGWKGTVLRIASKTVKRMGEEFNSNPKDILVGIGPSISAEKFETGDEVGEAFQKSKYDLGEISYRNEQTKRLHIDLQEANITDLESVGVMRDNIENSKLCTYSNPDLFFSARRQTINSGRMMTGGVLI